jgi:hypothetical protein
MKIDDLERLERSATPGPWEAKRDYSKDWLIAGHGKILVDSMDGGPHGERDIRLIAAARNALPALLAAIKAGRECADDLESVLRARYEGTLDYPSQAQRFERDMEPVRALRAALAALEAKQ